jgi:hypothetical protein
MEALCCPLIIQSNRHVCTSGFLPAPAGAKATHAGGRHAPGAMAYALAAGHACGAVSCRNTRGHAASLCGLPRSFWLVSRHYL